MSYTLFIGDRTFSSWSLRGWLMLEKFNLPHSVQMVGLYAGTMAKDLAPLAPAILVPVLRTPEGDVVGESLAIAETLAERHPEAEMWPKDAAHRLRARWLCAEMASGFSALRASCPMQLQHVNEGFDTTPDVQTDLARVEVLWRSARGISGAKDGWLFGAYSLADVFYAPVAARIIGYDLPVSTEVREYCLKTVSDPSFRQWRRDGLQVTYDPFPYPISASARPWPLD
ncbi:glutathione S-transferase [Roseobacter weihaiensis]|uniref:glutathione S-transferase n=1 Tax=Roseobacter weihaiensis TaxID=2763262 RepID=UPI001D09DB99|nr:glutathione S-transferase [Roseobacter sp. H9]